VNKAEAIIGYQTAMTAFKQLRNKGGITDNDLVEISRLMATKYGLSNRSLYLESNLLYAKERVSNSTKKG